MVLAINLPRAFRYSSCPGLSLAKGIRLENAKRPFVFRDIRILGTRRALLCKMAGFVRSGIAKPVSGTRTRARDFFESRGRPVNSRGFHGERAKGKTTGLVKNVVANDFEMLSSTKETKIGAKYVHLRATGHPKVS